MEIITKLIEWFKSLADLWKAFVAGFNYSIEDGTYAFEKDGAAL